MRKIVLLFILTISFFNCKIFAEDIIIKGNYYGKNLYVLNPSSEQGAFCVEKVYVNGKITKDEINSNSFEIDFSNLNLEIGDTVVIKIKHRKGCMPKIINAEVLRAESNFLFTTIKFDRSKKLIWLVKGNTGNMPFVIEQYRWKKWIQVGKVEVKDSVTNNNYFFQTHHPYYGMNKYRVKHIDINDEIIYSKEKNFYSRAQEILLAPKKIFDEIMFTKETRWEIFDEMGELIMDGFGNDINVSKLSEGNYWINYGNKTESFRKRKKK
jgi:hypothetical protein